MPGKASPRVGAEEIPGGPGGSCRGFRPSCPAPSPRLRQGPSQGQDLLCRRHARLSPQGGLTTAEQSLVDAGDLDAVHRLRRDARDAVSARAKAIVEEATGHRVSAYMSEIH